ncbi:lysophospholipase II [Nemania sp. FL0916]|nr:lysophospholipase II [Nemania sp. FL0916]
MASENLYIVPPKGLHTHMVIFLHGRDSNCREFADELFESEASKPADQPRTLPDLFPTIRWVFPGAPLIRSDRFDADISQWFDMWSVENPSERPELQYTGLQQSVQKILNIIKKEEDLAPREKIFLAGISQGFATAIAAFSVDTSKGFAGLIGLCSWMPAASHIEYNQRSENTIKLESSCEDFRRLGSVAMQLSGNTPIFLCHSIDDDVVPIENGRELRDILQSRHYQVEWKEYDDGGHWINEPRGVDDIVRFMNRHMVGGYSLSLEEKF